MRALSLVNQLWFIAPVSAWKFRVSCELLSKINRPLYPSSAWKGGGVTSDHGNNLAIFKLLK